MSKILVTGITGTIGKSTVKYLLKKGVPASKIIGFCRNKERSAELIAQGIEVRLGDYSDYDSLLSAFKGVDKVMLTSAVAFTDRATQHNNVLPLPARPGLSMYCIWQSCAKKAPDE
jgi:NAD(P)H dehydrogenase (quinone)